jgi:uridine kinase
MIRAAVLDRLAKRILDVSFLHPEAGAIHPLRVAIDGMDAAGKTILADELSSVIREKTGRAIIRASIDRFHNPREVRYRLGPDSPEGYYSDSFNLPALRQKLLDPLGQSGTQTIQTALFDFRSDTPVPVETIQVANDAILLFDGVFLLRPELENCWDFTILVRVTDETVLARVIQRDGPQMGGRQGVLDRYMTRYLPAQRRYLETCRPMERADVVVINDDPLNPTLQEKSAPAHP